MIAIDLSKQEVLDTDLKAMQIIYFTENLDPAGSAIMFFVIKEAKGPISEGTVRVL